MREFFRKPFGAAHASLFLVSVLCIAFFSVLFMGQTLRTGPAVPGVMPWGPYGSPGAGDFSGYTYGGDPGGSGWQIVAGEALALKQEHYFHAPLWNPHEMFGIPLLHNMQHSLFFPLKLILLFNSSDFAWDFYKLILFLIAGFFTYLYLTQIKVSRVPALIGAVGYMLSGILVMYAHFSFMDAHVCLPLLLYAFESWASSRTLRRLAVLSLSLGAVLLCGYPVPVFLACFYISIYVAYRLVEMFLRKEISLRTLWILTSGFSIAAFLAALIASPVLLSGVKLLNETQNVRPPGMGFGHGDISHFYASVFPYILTFLKSEHADLWCSWSGMIPFLLALLAFRDYRRPVVGFFLAFAVFGFMKLGGFAPAQWIAYLPGFSRVINARYLQPEISLSVAILAAFGARAICERTISFKTVCMVVVVFLGITLGTVYSQHDWYENWKFQNGPELPVVRGVVWAALLIVFCYFWLYRSNTKIWVTSVLLLIVASELCGHAMKPRIRRYDVFTRAPYLDFLDKDQSRNRVIGLDGILYPPYSSAFGIDDIRWMNGIAFTYCAEYIKEFLLPSATDRFTGGESDFAMFDPHGGLQMAMNLVNTKYVLSLQDLYNTSLTPIMAHEWNDKPGFAFNGSKGPKKQLMVGIKPGFSFRYDVPLRVDGNANLKLSMETENVEKLHATISINNQTPEKILLEKDLSSSQGFTDYHIDLHSFRGQTISLGFSVSPLNGASTDSEPLWIAATINYPSPGPRSLKLVYDKDIKIYENPLALPRAFMAHSFSALPDDAAVIAKMKESGFDPSKEVVLEPSGEPLPPQLSGDGGAMAAVDLRSYSDQKIELETSDSQPGMLFLSDTYYGNWHAYLDGVLVTTYRADLAFRSVFVPAGKHMVVFRYEDLLFFYSCLFFVVALFIVTGMLLRKV